MQAALAKAGTEDAVMVGDTPWDAKAAARAGIETVGVLTGGFAERELRDAGAVAVFESVSELRSSLDATPLGADAASVARAEVTRCMESAISASIPFDRRQERGDRDRHGTCEARIGMLTALSVLALVPPASASASGPKLTVPKADLEAAFKCPIDPTNATQTPLMFVTGTGATGDQGYLIGQDAFEAYGIRSVT